MTTPIPPASFADGLAAAAAQAATLIAPLTPKDIEQARGLMREVCSLASTAMGMSGDRVSVRDEDDVDALQTRIRILGLFIDRIGWVADVSLRKLGDSGSFARAEDWMLPGV